MKFHRCDRCNQEIKSNFWDGYPKPLTVMFGTYELCNDCLKSFEKWFKK